MKASSIVLLAAVVVLLGKWSKSESVDAKVVVGGLFSALIISVMDSAQPKLARGFAWLFLVVALLTYLAPLLENTLGKKSVVNTQAPGSNRVR